VCGSIIPRPSQDTLPAGRVTYSFPQATRSTRPTSTRAQESFLVNIWSSENFTKFGLVAVILILGAVLASG